MQKLKLQTVDMAERNIETLGQLFPSCLTEKINDEGKLVKAIDFDKLRQELACEVVEGAEERYQFTWPDKRNAIRLANAPTNKTLRPCREESVDFDNTENLYIEGDNLEVLKLLRENYLGKVKMIYIDPPYNTGNDFVYNDDFAQGKAEFEAQSGLFDEEGRRMADPMVQNTESNGRFHTDWLNMIYPRLKVAKDLLADDGVIFISIDDNEVENLKKVCDEVFGEHNFVANFLWKKKSTTSNVEGAEVSSLCDYTLCYKRTNDAKIKPRIKAKEERTYQYNDEEGAYRLTVIEKKDSGAYKRDSMKFPIMGHYPREGKRWQIGLDKARELEQKGRFVFDGEKILLKIYTFEDKDTTSAQPNLLDDLGSTDVAARTVNVDLFNIPELFSNPKPIELLKHLINITTNDGAFVLDFFSGSATTAHAVMQLNAEDGGNRRFIMVQLPELTDEKSEAYKAGYKNICEIGKERIRRAGKKIREELIVKRDNIKTELYNITGGAAFDSNPSSMSYFMTKADETKKNKATQLNKELIDLDSKIESFDTGFRVLKLDTSNMKDVYYTPAETPIQQTLGFEELVDNIKWNEGRTPEDLLFQILPECNLPLSSKIEEREIHGKKVFVVEDGYLMACFNKDINESVITAIAKKKPYYFVMCDRSMETDNVADNFEQIFEAYSKETVRRIL